MFQAASVYMRQLLDRLGPTLRSRLAQARQDLAAKASLNETCLLPAWRRYEGLLYKEAEKAIARAAATGMPIVIISGGYGLVLGEECIGWYNRRFSLRDWPPQLLEECLMDVTQACRVPRVVAFCAQTTDYAELIRRAPWSQRSIDAWLASPNMAVEGEPRRWYPRHADKPWEHSSMVN